ncbi:MAG: O-antigen ligase family protein [Bacteroidia bacterium]|nr:O-antigen ligase family protein [Bacteroidia bacterium]
MQRFLDTCSYFLAVAVAASFVLPIPVNSLLIILFLATTLLRFSYPVFKQNARSYPVLLFSVLLFILVLAGWLLSNNKNEAWLFAERKLSLVIFPVAFLILPSFSSKQLLTILRAYVLSVVIACLYMVSLAAISFFFFNANSDVFFYHNLSEGIHFNAIYLSMYCLFGCVFTLSHQLFNKSAPVVFIFLTFCIVLLSSKMVIALFLLVSLSYLILKIGLSVRFKITAALFTLLSFVIIIGFTPFLQQRFLAEIKSDKNVITKDKFVYNTPFSGATLRTVIWRHSLSILSEKKAWLTGVGTGDFQQLLNEKYEKSGMYMGNPSLGDSGYRGYNPHNQYIEFVLSQGLLGLLCWILWIIWLWAKTISGNHFAFAMLLLAVCFLNMTECFLSANKGVVWFVFFCSLFVVNNKIQTNSNKQLSSP